MPGTRSPGRPSSRRRPSVWRSRSSRPSPPAASDGGAVDLHLMEAAPTAEERAAVDRLLGPPSTAWDGGQERTASDLRVVRGGREARERRHLLLPALHALQGEI